MYYEEKFENGQWYRRGTPNGDWEPFDKDKEILAALVDGIGAAKSELATRPKMYHRRTLLFLMSQAANARPALKRMLERLEKLEAVAAAARDCRKVQQQREHDEIAYAASGHTYSIETIKCAEGALDAALEALNA